MNRRDALKFLAAGAALPALPRKAASAQPVPEETMETYIFKTVGDCRIKVDVYRASGGKAPRPVVMAIHGGALISGARYPIQMDFHEPLMKRGSAIVSIDYRLAPETKLPEIIKDVQDAYR
jgi:acetyl esterase/lipase